jgi:hypothetical protein
LGAAADAAGDGDEAVPPVDDEAHDARVPTPSASTNERSNDGAIAISGSGKRGRVRA